MTFNPTVTSSRWYRQGTHGAINRPSAVDESTPSLVLARRRILEPICGGVYRSG